MQSFTIEEFKKIHQTWKESGLSVRDYCANTGIKESRYMIDYNPIENCVRLLAIGRKNYMFCGNHDAAEEAAIMYTMMGCCKLAGVDFRKSCRTLKISTRFSENMQDGLADGLR